MMNLWKEKEKNLVVRVYMKNDSYTSSIHFQFGYLESNDIEEFRMRHDIGDKLFLENLELITYLPRMDDYAHGRTLLTPDRPHYDGVRFIDEHMVSRMLRTLKLIATRMRKMREKLGYTEDFSETISRFAVAVGAKEFIFEPEVMSFMKFMSLSRIPVRDARRYLDTIRDVQVKKEKQAC